MTVAGIPLTPCADAALGRLARATGADALARLDGATLLGERAMLAGYVIPDRTSAGGGCRLFDAVGDTVALNLARPDDRELLPALLETDLFDTRDDRLIALQIARKDARTLVERGRSMGLAIAAVHEQLPGAKPCVDMIAGSATHAAEEGLRCNVRPHRTPRVIDLSALWAGPLAAHLLWLAGAEVVKVESRTRPDPARHGDPDFFALLNQGKQSVVLDFNDHNDLSTLRSLIAASDIVIEAARPRALEQLGLHAADMLRTTPGLAWITITGHGAQGEPAQWVGFGDDCGVAGGLTAALQAETGQTGLVGDAIADPLTGIFAALSAWDAWAAGRSGRFGLAMSHVVAHCLADARRDDPQALRSSLREWTASVGRPFPRVARRPAGALPAFGAQTRSCLERLATC
jgi:hypothetical protein